LFRQKIAAWAIFEKLFSAVSFFGAVLFDQPAMRGFIFVLVGVVRIFHSLQFN